MKKKLLIGQYLVKLAQELGFVTDELSDIKIHYQQQQKCLIN